MEEEKLRAVKTHTEAAKILGYTYYNGRIKKVIERYCQTQYGFNLNDIIEKNNENHCLCCDKLIKSGKKFCSSSCAAKYNNKLRAPRSEESRRKTSASLIEHYLRDKQQGKRVLKIKNGAIHTKKVYEKTCPTCGKIFYGSKKQEYCSMKCAHSNEDYKNKIRVKVKERIENGTFSGWKTRGKRSYPEKFWENVLNNNSISFIPEDFSTKKYFLDFLIEKNGKKIDLEIDGKQHKERKEHDIERDSFLAENGFIVYRVKWNSINSEVGKTRMKEKIDKFLEFYSGT